MSDLLAPLLTTFARRRNARVWLGERPEGRIGALPRIIAAKVGYPTASDNPFDHDGLEALCLTEAAHVLAVAGTTSLAYGRPVPRVGWLARSRAALKELERDAAFFSNGLWNDGVNAWSSLSSATFDCGLIGFDAQRAFIFWVEEED